MEEFLTSINSTPGLWIELLSKAARVDTANQNLIVELTDIVETCCLIGVKRASITELLKDHLGVGPDQANAFTFVVIWAHQQRRVEDMLSIASSLNSFKFIRASINGKTIEEFLGFLKREKLHATRTSTARVRHFLVTQKAEWKTDRAYRETDRQPGIQTASHTGSLGHKDKQAGTRTCRQTDRVTCIHTGIHTDRPTGRQAYTHTYTRT